MDAAKVGCQEIKPTPANAKQRQVGEGPENRNGAEERMLKGGEAMTLNRLP